jgi:hypothetical protein
MERPEDKCRTLKMFWYFIVAGLDQGHDTFQVLLLTHFLFRKRFPFNESHDENSVCVIDNFWRDAGGVGRTRGRDLVKAHYSVNRDVFANPNDKTLALIVNDEIDVGNSATQRFGRYM